LEQQIAVIVDEVRMAAYRRSQQPKKPTVCVIRRENRGHLEAILGQAIYKAHVNLGLDHWQRS
jgi:hypothetical protein